MRSLYPLILITASSLVAGQNTYYTNLGCFNTDLNPKTPALPSNEGKGYPELDGAPDTRVDPVQKCFELALRLGHNIFAIQRGSMFGLSPGSCLSRVDTVPGGAYAPPGKKTTCVMYNANEVFQINPSLLPQNNSKFFNLGCFTDNSLKPILVSNEGKGHPELNGAPSNRTDAIEKCFQVATRLNHSVFAVQNGNCSSSNPTPLGSFARYGMASLCPSSGRGANLTSHVYLVNALSYISSLGCWNDGPTDGFEGVRFLANISSSLADPIRHCAGLALSRVGPNVTVFALQTVPGDSSILKCSAQRDIVSDGSYSAYGASTTCPSRGTGAAGVNHVYQLKDAPKLEFNWSKLDYKNVGCYRAKPVTRYRVRNAFLSIDLCYQTAVTNSHPVFFVNAYGCWTGYDFAPGGKYATLGPAPFCRYDGIGESTNEMDTHQVYVIKSAQPKTLNLGDLPRMGNLSLFPYSSLGCVTANRYWSAALPFRMVHSGIVSTVNDCYNRSLQLRHNIFGIIHPSTCISSWDIIPGGNYSSLPSSDCPSHTTKVHSKAFFYGTATTQLFQVNNMPLNSDLFPKSSNWTHLGCYLIEASWSKFVNPNDFRYSSLNGDQYTRLDAIQKCYQVAKNLKHTEFALVSGGTCLSRADSTFSSGSRSSLCLSDQRGGHSLTYYAFQGPSVGGNVYRILR